MGSFEEKFIIVLVVVGFRYMSIPRFEAFRIMSRSRKLIQFLFSYVRLSCISVCTWFMNVRVCPCAVIYNQYIFYVTCIEYYDF